MGIEGLPYGRTRGTRICVAGLVGCALGVSGPMAVAAADEGGISDERGFSSRAGMNEGSWDMVGEPRFSEFAPPGERGPSTPGMSGVSWARWAPSAGGGSTNIRSKNGAGENSGPSGVSRDGTRGAAARSRPARDAARPVRLATSIAAGRPDRPTTGSSTGTAAGRLVRYVVTVQVKRGTAREVRLRLIARHPARWGEVPRYCRREPGTGDPQLVCELGTLRAPRRVPVTLRMPLKGTKKAVPGPAMTAVATAVNARRTRGSTVSTGAPVDGQPSRPVGRRTGNETGRAAEPGAPAPRPASKGRPGNDRADAPGGPPTRLVPARPPARSALAEPSTDLREQRAVPPAWSSAPDGGSGAAGGAGLSGATMVPPVTAGRPGTGRFPATANDAGAGPGGAQAGPGTDRAPGAAPGGTGGITGGGTGGTPPGGPAPAGGTGGTGETETAEGGSGGEPADPSGAAPGYPPSTVPGSGAAAGGVPEEVPGAAPEQAPGTGQGNAPNGARGYPPYGAQSVAPGGITGGGMPGTTGPYQPVPGPLLPSLAPPPGTSRKPKPSPSPSPLVATPVGAPDRQSHWATLIAMVAFAQSALLWLAVTLFLRYRRLVREGVTLAATKTSTVATGTARRGTPYAGVAQWLRGLVRRR